MSDSSPFNAEGHCLIRYADTKEIIVSKKNAIHFENLSEAIALSLANRPNGNIHEMVFGNGASTVSGIGTVTYFPPNSTGQLAQLYNQTFRKVINDLSPLNTDPTENYIRVQHTKGTTYSDIVMTCTLNTNEPAGQNATDTGTSTETDYIFDEIGIKSYNTISGNGKLLAHVIFHPVQKSLNRTIEIIYTIRVFMS